MADTKSSDILMRLVAHGVPIRGESTSALAPPGKAPSELLRDFAPNAMFEISQFGFSVGDDSQLENSKDEAAAKSGDKSAAARIAARKQASGSHGISKVTVQPLTFSRVADRASTMLLQYFIRRTYFDRAAIVKRKASGSNAAGEAYLRFDLKGVILNSVSWSNDDPVKESYSLYARAVTMRYRPQLPDGTLGAVRTGFWSMAPNEQVEPIG